MRVALSDEEGELQQSLRQMLAKECSTRLVRDLQQTGEPMSSKLWSALVQMGVFGLALPESLGGVGGELFDLGLFYEEAGRVLCPTIVYSTLAFRLAMQRLASTELQQRWLPRLAAGDLTASVALWNPSDSGDLASPLIAQRRGDDWVLSGELTFVANADVADVLLVSAVTAADGPARSICCIVAPNCDGWNATRHLTFGRDDQCRVNVRDLVVHASEIIGSSGIGIDHSDVTWVSNAVTGLQCMEMTGGGMAVIDRTVNQVKTRHQFNRPIASFQAAQHHVANMHIAVDGARLAAQQAVWWLGRGRLAQREIAIAKLKCNEAYKFATLTAHQLHGGMGYLRETDLHLWSERAKVTELLGGAWDVQLMRLEQALAFID